MRDPILLSDLLVSLGSTELLRQANIFSRWRELVGEMAASNSRPLKLKSKVLSVATRDSVWATQLSFIKGTIIEKINAEFPSTVNDIRFSQAGWVAHEDSGKRPGIFGLKLDEKEVKAADRLAQDAPAFCRAHIANSIRASKLVIEEKKKMGWRECPSCGRLAPPTGCAFCGR